MERLAKAEQRVRAFANRSGVYERFSMAREDDWNSLCVAMDTFGDSASAHINFEENGLGSGIGERYLRLYGALQAIVLQQDAIATIYSIYIGKSPIFETDSGWQRCRKLRNRAIGHPLNSHGSKEQGRLRVFVSRSSISSNGFDLMICPEKVGGHIFESVDFKGHYERYKNEALELIALIEDVQISMSN